MTSRLTALFTTAAFSIIPVLTGSPAGAVTVTVNLQDYDVTFFDGSFDNNTSLFQIPPTGQMPWWGDATGSLAADFALQVYDKLGIGSNPGYGPYFAYQFVGTDLESISQNITDPNSQNLETTTSAQISKYAIATPLFVPPVPAPSPLPVFGVLAAFAGARKLRRRTMLPPSRQD